MKLYTEEQIRSAMYLSDKGDYDTYSQILNQFTPIELPSDEEIDDVAFASAINGTRTVFIAGAKWMRNKIQEGNK